MSDETTVPLDSWTDLVNTLKPGTRLTEEGIKGLCFAFKRRDDEIESLQSELQAEREKLRFVDPKDDLPKSAKAVEVLMRFTGTERHVVFVGYYCHEFEQEVALYDEECNHEYHEERDRYYMAEGWYECQFNWPEYTSIAVCEGEVVGWRPIINIDEEPDHE